MEIRQALPAERLACSGFPRAFWVCPKVCVSGLWLWSHRRADDALATRVILDIESQTADTITTVLYIGLPSPNLTQVRHTFRRQGSAWTLLLREGGPEIRI